MDKSIYIIGIILIVGVALLVAYYHYRKKNLDQFFSQVYLQAKQVPKQKKNSFLLLLFKESILASKNKKNASSLATKFQNPKFLETQLIQMSRVLKDSSNVKDKTMKKALNLLKSYHQWEKIQKTKK
ncbi:hypothetical protein RH915_02640 [Serpentinicella sp. ANB-PHB4]|uniref:hypothetical protein n=1 Tax=Serpentinicella sp. ANB-PHB4 TaxID=3074076 RepID=UPI002859B12C|nr:hypothetical protein [Serpentinicella sp. ANB-PHB4]MDR5658379.1 hypothetical protein [Serpentinicella sp. ANB-PHB4]